MICDESESARVMAGKLASGLIESNNKIFCVWFAFEPGSFRPGARFKNSFLRKDGAVIELTDDLADHVLDSPEKSPWYNIPLNTGRPYFDSVDYYDYGFGFEYSATIAYPVFVGEKVVGCIGLDVHYDQVYGFIKNANDTDNAVISLLADDGEIIFSTDGRLAKSNAYDRISNEADKQSIREALGRRESYRAVHNSVFTDGDSMVNLIPVDLPHASRHLSLAVRSPARFYFAETDRARRNLLLACLLGAVSLGVAVYLVTKNIIKPVRTIVGKAERIADGNHDGYEPVYVSATESVNEIHVLEKAILSILEQLQEKHQLELAAVQAKAEHEKVVAGAESKLRFFASISHEIRTPMNAVLGLSQLLMDQPLGDEPKRYVHDIKTSAESLLRVINDVLDLSKLEIGKLELAPEPFDLHAMLDSVASIFTVLARQKNLEFRYSLASDVPRCIRGDPHRCRQILNNLIGNAVKFTKKGRVELRVTVDDGNMRCVISDTGPGIREADQAGLFEAFRQLKTDSRAQGTGLGLSISIGLAKVMGGGIRLESEYGAGSTFHVWIPFTPCDESFLDIEDKKTSVRFRNSVRVLVVDDNRVNLVTAKGLIKKFGIQCDTAMSAKEAISRLEENEYDIVFMDHMMPEMDGIEATRHIRGKGGRFATQTIIALTANVVAVGKDTFLYEGMNDLLSKPIEIENLRQILRRWIPEEKQYRDTF